MGRRKKEPESTHRENIALAAERLFVSRGFNATTMDDVAKEAGYSKATLYVYFSSKEEIISYLVLKSMKMLHSCLSDALSGREKAKVIYRKVCSSLTLYQEQYPLYFSLALGEINVDLDRAQVLPVEREIFEVGERINEEMVRFIRRGIETGEFSPDVPILETVFLFWGSLTGVIQLAASKQNYMQKSMNLSREEFLNFCFEKLYRMIGLGGEDFSKSEAENLQGRTQ